MSRVNISVECITYADGSIVRRRSSEDGRTWNIERVIHMVGPVNNEFEGIRYTTAIGSAVKIYIG